MQDHGRHRSHRLRLTLAAVPLVAAWSIPFLGHLFSIRAFAGIPLWVPLTLLLVSAIGVFVARAGTRVRLGLAVAILCTTGALAALQSRAGSQSALEPTWRRESSLEMARTLAEVGDEVSRMEVLSTSIGERVGSYLRSLGDDDADDEATRFITFELLDSLAVSISQSRVLPPGTEIGIQVFDGAGARMAWAGWPQSTARIDETFIDADKEMVYSREVSLYRILTHLIPVHESSGARIATVMVDMPLEVNFRVNNRFLKSTSIAENIAHESLANLSFEYYPTMTNLADRLDRFAREQERNQARREKLLEEGRSRLERRRARDDAGPGGDAAAEDVQQRRARLTIEDSVLTYYPFPALVEPVSEISGDRSTGLQGRIVIRAPQGNPLLKVTAIGHPFRHFASEREGRDLLVGRLFLLLAFVVLFFVAAGTARGRTSGRVLARSVLYAGFVVLLRYALLPIYTISPSAGIKILDPTVFATPILGGIMRSAGDLLVTALMFVAALYGLLRIIRGRGAATAWFGDTGAGSVRAWHVVVKGAVTAAVLYVVFELCRRFASTIVVNSNPRLLGETMRVTDLEVLVLHLSMFLIFTGIILAGILLVWGMFRLTRGSGLFRSSLVALATMIGVGVAAHGWGPVLVSALLLLFVVLAPRFVQREDLVSIVIASFCLVVISSAVAYVFLSVDYDTLRKSFVLEKSDELLNPTDDWKVVILEDILGEYALRSDVRNAMRSPASQDVQRLAFDLWAESPLSLLGYSCALHVITAEDSVVSDFSVDMPYRVRITEGSERTDSPGDSEWAVLDLTRNTPRGIVRFYRGILNITEMRTDPAGGMSKQVVGRVIVDLPFFFESLEWAARTGPRTPEVLRNVQEGGVAPRVEEPEALLLARLDGRQVHESSSEHLPLGLRIPEETFARAVDRKWPLLNSNSGTFRIVVRESDDGRYLLAGFAVPSPARHILRWSTLFSLYLVYTFAILVAIILLGTIPYLKEALPTLTPGRKLGFQQKLLASFLMVALVPAIILGVFSVNFIKDRFVEENRKEALYKAFSARKAFVNILHGESQFFLNQPEATSLFSRGDGAGIPVGNRRVVRLIRDTGTDSDVAAAGDSTVTSAPGVLDDVSSDDLFFFEATGGRYIGVMSAPVRVTRGEWSGSFYVLYGRLVDSELLSEIAAQVGADVNIYDDGELVASSREGLLAGGFISAIMNAGAFLKVSVLGSDYSLATERAGQYSYQVAYLPVAGWANRADSVAAAGGAGPGTIETNPASAVGMAGGEHNNASAGSGGLAGIATHAAMSVPLLFRPESYYAEVQKATSIVLGIFALLFAATIGLGLVLARGIFEPLRALLAGTRRISQGDFSVQLPMRRADEIGSVVTAFNEMTERVAESQRVLDERRRYLETILENIGTGVISTDADDRIRTVNASAHRILGIAEGEAVGKTARELVDGDVAPEIFTLLAGAMDMRGSFVADEVELGAVGDTATVKYMLTRLEVEGRYLGTVFVFEDLTELIQSKKLSAWVEMARQIAHEIKNPLTPIRISTQFMQRAYEQRPEQFDRVFREGTETILHQVDVLKRIAGEFSSYGRMQEIEVAPHPIDPIIRKIVAPYENNSAGVRVSYENGLSDATVLVDPEAVRKICTNLIENALDAMNDGGELRVSCDEQHAGSHDFVRVVFRDTGPGLSEEAGRKLFEPYFSTKTTGTGLGLAICRQLSYAMGGDVTVHNVAGGPGVEAAVTLRVAPRAQS